MPLCRVGRLAGKTLRRTKVDTSLDSDADPLTSQLRVRQETARLSNVQELSPGEAVDALAGSEHSPLLKGLAKSDGEGLEPKQGVTAAKAPVKLVKRLLGKQARKDIKGSFFAKAWKYF